MVSLSIPAPPSYEDVVTPGNNNNNNNNNNNGPNISVSPPPTPQHGDPMEDTTQDSTNSSSTVIQVRVTCPNLGQKVSKMFHFNICETVWVAKLNVLTEFSVNPNLQVCLCVCVCVYVCKSIILIPSPQRKVYSGLEGGNGHFSPGF